MSRLNLHTLLTGQDNSSLAIGRVLGAGLFVIFLLALPAAISATFLAAHVPAATWFGLLSALEVYIPVVTAAVGGLIAGTAQVEPKAVIPVEKDSPRG